MNQREWTRIELILCETMSISLRSSSERSRETRLVKMSKLKSQSKKLKRKLNLRKGNINEERRLQQLSEIRANLAKKK